MNFIKKLIGSCSILLVALFTLAVFMRILEFAVVIKIHYLEDMWASFFNSLAVDLKVSALLALIFGLLRVLLANKKWLSILLVWVPLSVLLMVHLGLVFYFTTVLEPLDNALFKHSLSEMSYVLKEFGEFRAVYLLILLLPLVLWGATRLTLKGDENFRSFHKTIQVFFGLSFLFLCIQPALTLNRGDFDNFKNYYLVSNKSVYLFSSVTKSKGIKSNISPKEAINLFHENHDKEFVSDEYPLLRLKEDGSVLSPYFKKDSTPPNIVFVVVESLSASFSGDNARLSFTPFLDSLSSKSLTFESFLSNGERTFSVLPSSQASLPHGRNGFTQTGLKMPRFESVPQKLIERGYETAFFYGGYAHYSFYDTFMEMQGVDKIYERSEYNYEGTGKVLSEDDIPFGVDDGEMFQSALGALDSLGENQPYCHTYLTLTMHYPFRFGDQKRFLKETNQRIQNSRLDKKEKEIYGKYDYILSSILYTDRSLQNFFEKYKERPEFENTIFLIYGDHRISGLPFSNDLDVYHVPMIIYSPLIENTQKFPAVNSHLDVPPSLMALLESNYGMQVPDSTHWIGSQFDTSSVFQSNRRFGMMLNNRNMEEYVYDNYFYSFDKLFKMEPGLELVKTEDDSLKKHIQSMMRNDQLVGEFAINNNRITRPDPLAIERHQVLVDQPSSESNDSFGKNTEFESLMNYVLSQDFEEIQLTVDLSWDTEITEEIASKMPLLVVVVKKENGEPLWSGYNIQDLMMSESGAGEKRIMLEELVRSSRHLKLESGDEVSVYFWNQQMPDKEFIYKKHTVKLMGIPKD
jgi:uncharacterized sulfatase